MGGYDCFCAFCGGPIVYCEIGPDDEETQQLRERFIQRKRQEIETGVSPESDDDDEFSDDEDAQKTYDPDLVTEESLDWTGTVYALGYNFAAPGIQKTFIAGPGSYNHNGGLEVPIGDDPNHPEGKSFFGCYGESSHDEIRLIPFHWCCYEIFSKAATGSLDVKNIDREVLYDLMSEFSDGDDLGLEYGELLGRDQYWECVPGEEFCVTHPTDVPKIKEILQVEAASELFNNVPSSGDDFHGRVTNDPFGNIPYDALHMILSFLPGSSVLELIKASRPVHSATRYNEFWKHLIHWDMPWFWELHEVIKELRSKTLDYRSFYLWLNKVTTPTYGMEGPFLGLANRRRIWGACQQLADLYYEKTHRTVFTPDTPCSRAIMLHSESLQTPLVLYPRPEDSLTASRTQWIYSWDEVDNRPSTFEAFYNSDNYLIGLAVTFGKSMRVFGSTVGASKYSKRIGESEWITGLAVQFPLVNLFEKNPAIAIQGITLVFKYGKTHTLGRSGNSRAMLASDGRYVVGVTGEVGEDGLISCLGVLEAPRPPNDDISLYAPEPTSDSSPILGTSSLPFARRQLWASHFPAIALKDKPYIHVLPQHGVDPVQDEFPRDLVAHEVLVWAKNGVEFSKVERISAYICETVVTSLNSAGISEKKCANVVLGLRAQHIERYWEPKRYIGLRREQNEAGDLVHWPEPPLQHFDIDGPGGERVTEVETALMDLPAAIKQQLRTNWGRECCFGDANQRNWDIQRAPEGEFIMGLAVAFGRRTMYDGVTGKFTHLSPSSISALAINPDENPGR
ncbi:hypothetical protein FQN54_005830 [Arachnomyces sp. PD_36]|nr:hypothetical protein FQN54_005830 [Arachnomyces sp. PD_36]